MEKNFENEIALLVDSVKAFIERFPDAGVCLMAVNKGDMDTSTLTCLNASGAQLTQMIADMISHSPKVIPPISRAISEGIENQFYE